MKKFVLPLVVAAMGSMMTADAAPIATAAEAELTMISADAKLVSITPRSGGYAFAVEPKKVTSAPWYHMTIPYELRAKARSNGPKKELPLFVDELKVHVYMLFDMGRKKNGDDKFVMLQKEISYVDIPLPDQDKGSGIGKNKDVYAGVFLSPLDAVKLSEEIVEPVSDKPDKYNKVKAMENRLAAVACEFYFQGAECSDKDYLKKNPKGVLVKKEFASRLKDGWWKANQESPVQLRAINETPFAPFYAEAFPATAQLYGTATTGAAAPTTGTTMGGTTSDPTGGYVPAGATDSDTTSSDDSADTSEDEEESTKSSKKKSKKKSRRRK